MVKHFIECSEPWYSQIKSGVKKVEGRKGTDKWKLIKPNDELVFFCERNSFVTRVTKINEYLGKDALKEYLETEGLKATLPGVESLQDDMNVYLQWSTPEQITEYGFLGIHIEVI